MDVLDSYMEAAEHALENAMDTAIYGDGINGGKSLTGLATAVPITTNTGVYGGIPPVADNAIWRTTIQHPHRVLRPSAPRSTRPRSGRC